MVSSLPPLFLAAALTTITANTKIIIPIKVPIKNKIYNNLTSETYLANSVSLTSWKKFLALHMEIMAMIIPGIQLNEFK